MVIVIGAGAAGLMAAGRAAELGAEVTVLEKMNRPGRKLLISGKGRCNVTNTADLDDFIKHFPGSGRFLYSAFSRFGNQALMEFFEKAGVKLKAERGGRVFPESDNAGEVVRALIDYCRAGGVSFRFNTPAGSIESKDGRAAGVTCGLPGESVFFPAGSIILATGGASYPGTGSTGDGYRLAEGLGHKVNPIYPSLVPLEVAEEWVPPLKGLALKNVRVTARFEGQDLGEEFGEMLFTHFGVSGPIILTLSRVVGQALRRHKHSVGLSIDLKPALPADELDSRILRDFKKYQRKQLKNALDDLLPQALIPVLISLSGIPEDLPVHQVSRLQRQRLVELLKGLSLTVVKTRSLHEAIVTAGGIDVREIDPRTMESRVIPGLYLAGEVIDIDAYTGGFNLQAAFSTGYLAGTAAAGRG